MHVLLTVNAAWNVRNFRWPIVRALLARGDRVTVVAPRDEAVPGLEAEGVRFLPLEMHQEGLHPLENLRVAAQLAATFRRERPDVILSWTIKNNIFGALAARAFRIPFIPNVSGLGTAFLSGSAFQRVAETLYRLAFRSLPAVFFQNAEDRALFVERRLVRTDSARLLPGSGIDLARFAAAAMPEGPPAFLMIARLLRHKGVAEYFEAARLVRAEYPEARLRLVGASGGNRTAISEATLQTWLCEGHVEWLGPTNDVRPEIAASHCVVLPSYREGAPRTLIEAAAMARPVIATDVAGCREVVEDGVTGWLCEVCSGESLAAAMASFIAMSGTERALMGARGRAKMEREYDEAIVVAAYLAEIARQTGR